VPLAIPILAGPGSITTVMLLVGAKWQPGSILLTVTAVGVVSYLTYLAFRYSYFISRRMGPLEMNIVSRVMGLILAVIAVQMGMDGVKELLPGLK